MITKHTVIEGFVFEHGRRFSVDQKSRNISYTPQLDCDDFAKLEKLVCTSLVDTPHIVICCDLMTGDRSYLGPFPDAVTALTAAHHESEDTDDDTRLEFSVAPLLKP